MFDHSIAEVGVDAPIPPLAFAGDNHGTDRTSGLVEGAVRRPSPYAGVARSVLTLPVWDCRPGLNRSCRHGHRLRGGRRLLRECSCAMLILLLEIQPVQLGPVPCLAGAH